MRIKEHFRHSTIVVDKAVQKYGVDAFEIEVIDHADTIDELNEKPEIFKAGFNKELQDHIYTIWKDPEQKIIVAESEGMICGFAVLHHIHKLETPFMQERDFIDIDEFCVDKKYRRQGIASEMIAFIKAYTKEQGINCMELNMWEFNEDALAFYEAVGFKTYRRYMEMML